jgi:hypothetical protein
MSTELRRRHAVGRRHRGSAAALVAVAAVVMAACAPMPPEPATGPSPNDAPRAGEAAYAEHGPYEVGVTTISLSDRQMEVWYPVDPQDIGTAPRDEYFIRDYVSEAFEDLIPDDVNPPYVTDATCVPASADGVPLVLFSHGFASCRAVHLPHHPPGFLGIRGHLPRLPRRGLRSVLGEPPPVNRADTAVADEAIEAARTANTTSGGLLEGRIDSSTVFPIGHSAGGGTTLRLLSRPDVVSGIPMAAGLGPTQLADYAELLPAGKAVTWIGANRDSVAAIANVRNGYTYTSGERRLLEIGNAGHVNAFSDICKIGGGGAVAIARAAGIPVPESLLALGNDGCNVPPFKDSLEVWPEVRHFVTAELRLRAGLDAEPVGLGDQVLTNFDDIVRYKHTP